MKQKASIKHAGYWMIKSEKPASGFRNEKRKPVVLGLCILLVIIFSIVLWDSFHNQEVHNILKTGHIEPLDLPKDSLIHKLKDLFHE